VQGVAITPDGLRALSWGFDRTVRLWEVATGRELRQFRHDGPILAATFLPDGRRFASGGYDSTIRLWDVETGQELRRIHCPGYVQSVAVSPDGRFLLSGPYSDTGDSEDCGVLRLWDVETGAEVRQFLGHTSTVKSIAFAPDGLRAVSASFDKTVRLWDVATGRELRRLEAHQDWVCALALLSDGRRAVSGDKAGSLILWDFETGRVIRRLDGHWNWVRCIAVLPDGRRAVSGDMDGRMILWDLDTGQELHGWKGLAPHVGIALLPDGRHVLTGDADARVRLWLMAEDALQARDLARLGRSDEAADAFARAVASRPEDLDLKREAARYLQTLDRASDAKDVVTSGIDRRPEDLNLLRSRGEELAIQGRWTEAAADYARLIELDPSNLNDWTRAAPLFLYLGDVKEYRRCCLAMLDRFGAPNDPQPAEMMAKACLLASETLDDPRPAELADRAVTLGASHRYFFYFQLAKGMADYRRGAFEDAIAWCDKSQAQAGGLDFIGAMGQLFQAMSYLRLNRADQGLQSLNQARKIMAEFSNGGHNWHDWLACQIIRREAETLWLDHVFPANPFAP
ncbi:MAG: tetratricopeptide repeat protein, partial [Isosphaeraceae bacterium]